MTELQSLRLYATHPHPCSYLPEQEATTLFIDPAADIDGTTYSELSDFGFRRSGRHIYKPKCQSCSACIPIRIPVAQFRPNRKQRRCLKRNVDVSIHEVDTILSDEHYRLYHRYISERHGDGDMYPPSYEQYEDFLSRAWDITHFWEFRVGEQLLGVSVIDRLARGLSALYAFFDPAEPRRSLGVFNILKQIEHCQSAPLPYVYLGYWIRDCQKMRYKMEYQPFELLVDRAWVTVNHYP